MNSIEEPKNNYNWYNNPNDFFNPDVWLPHYIFILYTIAFSYPTQPNEVTRRKYYDFIQNFPIFIPHESFSNQFACYLDQYPVSPYLVSRESFMRWVSFIHNKINFSLGKPETSYLENMDLYMKHYSPPVSSIQSYNRYFPNDFFHRRSVLLFFTIIFIIFIMIYLHSY